VRRALLVATAAVSLAACGDEALLDTKEAERTIAERLAEASGQEVTVSCPDDVPIEQGNTFDCDAEADGREVTVRVRQVDDDGRVRFRVLQRR
jgi:hypothetical protein